MSSGRPLRANALAGSSAACQALLWLAVLSAYFGSAASSSPNPSGTDSDRLGRAAAADAVLAEAFAYFGASQEPPLAPLWRVAALEATLEGSGFHRRRGFEVVLQRSSACDGLSGPGLGSVLGAAAAAAAEGACLPADGESCARAGVCEVAVLQALPAGVFADPYELAGLERQGGARGLGSGLGFRARARVFGPVDLEALEPFCSPTLLALWGQALPRLEKKKGLGLNNALHSNCDGTAVAARMAAPLHARYAAPRLPTPTPNSSAWRVLAGAPAVYVLLAPLVLARCRGPQRQAPGAQQVQPHTAGEGVCTTASCGAATWAGNGSERAACGGIAGERQGLERSEGGPVGEWEVVSSWGETGRAAGAEWRVPTGNPAHKGLVAVITAGALLLASALIVHAALAY